MSTSREARQLLRAHRYGALCTLSKKSDVHLSGSITPYLVDHDGSLLTLASTLAEHTRNIRHDPHIQTQGRITVIGEAHLVTEREQADKRYLRFFPEAETYLAMHDFSFYRIVPQALHYIGGFGNIHWIKAENYVVPPYPLIGQEGDVVAHMNADHQNALRNCCRHFHQCEAVDVGMLGIDCDGYDVRTDGKVLRFDFAKAMLDAQQARMALVTMSHL